MKDYLNSSFDLDDPHLISALDDLPLWSAPFGLALLDHVPMESGMTVLDIGFGTGFPLLELAQRLGESSTLYGIDPWQAAIERTRHKMEMCGINNVRLLAGDASSLDFKADTFDLIMSNTGINNFKKPRNVLQECYRTAKHGAHIVLTTNPTGHMKEFYDVFEETLKQLDLSRCITDLNQQRDHRLSIEKLATMLQTAKFRITQVHQKKYIMRFLNADAFFNHHLIRVGFLDGWKQIVPQEKLAEVFAKLEENLDASRQLVNHLRFTIPVIYIEGEKP